MARLKDWLEMAGGALFFLLMVLALVLVFALLGAAEPFVPGGAP